MLVCKPSEGEFCLCVRDATCIVSISTKAVRYRDDGSRKRINLRYDREFTSWIDPAFHTESVIVLNSSEFLFGNIPRLKFDDYLWFV